MASVTLTDLWVHLLDDPTQYVTLEVFGGLTDTPQVLGEVRRYAGGRRRVVRRVGRPRSVSFSSTVDRDTLATLTAWAGESVMVRDPGGRLVYGVYFDLTADELDGGDWIDINIAVEEISHSVEV